MDIRTGAKVGNATPGPSSSQRTRGGSNPAATWFRQHARGRLRSLHHQHRNLSPQLTAGRTHPDPTAVLLCMICFAEITPWDILGKWKFSVGCWIRCIYPRYLYLRRRIQWLFFFASAELRDQVLERPPLLLLLIQCFVWLYSSTHLIQSNKRQLLHTASS